MQCACPAGRVLLDNSCYDASPAWAGQGLLPTCPCGYFALPGDTTCWRSCADAEADYGSTAGPCLSLQACGPSGVPGGGAVKLQGWTFAQVC